MNNYCDETTFAISAGANYSMKHCDCCNPRRAYYKEITTEKETTMKQKAQLLDLALQVTKLKTLVAKQETRINYLWTSGAHNKTTPTNITIRKMKPSTFETIREHRDVLQAFAQGLANNYNPNIDGHDMWTAYEFADGSYADINIWLAGGSLVCITAYPVDEEGEINSSSWMRIYQESLPKRTTNGKFNK